jgi:hypothetical protein
LSIEYWNSPFFFVPHWSYFISPSTSAQEALDAEKWHYPDGFFMLASMTQVHRAPQRQD